jgi:hypothetical protein
LPRKKLVLPQEKNAPWFCPRFASTKSHAVNVAIRPCSGDGA